MTKLYNFIYLLKLAFSAKHTHSLEFHFSMQTTIPLSKLSRTGEQVPNTVVQDCTSG
jgi:hypothetical protein